MPECKYQNDHNVLFCTVSSIAKNEKDYIDKNLMKKKSILHSLDNPMQSILPFSENLY